MKKILPIALAVIGVLALLILVPTSPALIVDMPETLLFFETGVDEWGSPAGISVTVYGLFITVGAAIAITLAYLLGRKQKAGGSSIVPALVSGVFALCCSHWLFCALRWSYIINDLCETPWFILQFWKGGYTMYGAILGALLGTFVYARMKRLPLAPAMDAIMPGAAVILMLGRFAERFTLQGMGTYVVNEALYMIPFVSTNEWGEAQVPVYLYESLAAALALVVMLVILLRGKSRAGLAAEAGLTIISAAQVMLDSWRGDELIRFGFVRLNMICAAVTLLGLMILRVIRAVKQDGKASWWTILRVVLLFAGAAIVLIVEFGLDGKMGITASNTLLYAIQLAAVILMGTVVLTDGKKALK